MRTCQRVWHACEPPYYRKARIIWTCRECGSVWRFEGGDWWRDAKT